MAELRLTVLDPAGLHQRPAGQVVRNRRPVREPDRPLRGGPPRRRHEPYRAARPDDPTTGRDHADCRRADGAEALAALVEELGSSVELSITTSEVHT